MATNACVQYQLPSIRPVLAAWFSLEMLWIGFDGISAQSCPEIVIWWP